MKSQNLKNQIKNLKEKTLKTNQYLIKNLIRRRSNQQTKIILKQKNLVFNWGCPDETPLTKYSEWIYSDWIEIQIKNDQYDLSLQPDEYLRDSDTETDDGSGVGF